MATNNYLTWVKYIDQAMKIHLNRKHRTIGMSPLEGDKKEKEKNIREIYLERYKKVDSERKKNQLVIQ